MTTDVSREQVLARRQTEIFARPEVSRRLDFIDGLRAIAILMVFLTHATELLGPLSSRGVFLTRATHELNLGRTGVVTFFAVSGFLIPSSLHGSPAEATIRFLASRVFRLYPAFLVSVFVSICGLYLGYGYWLDKTDVLLNLTMLPRLFGGEFANGGYWTLEVEMVFYALSLFLCLGGVVGNQFVLACAMFGNFFVFYTSQASVFGGALNPALSADTFFWCLNLSFMFWGAICRRWREDRKLELLPALLFWTFAAYWMIYIPFRIARTCYLSLPLDIDTRLEAGYGGALMVFGLILLTEASLGRLMSWIGRISYSFYLLHVTAILLMVWALRKWPLLQGQPLELNLVYTTVLSVAFADVSYRFIERPAIRAGRRLADWLVKAFMLPRREAVTTRTAAIRPMPETAVRPQPVPGGD